MIRLTLLGLAALLLSCSTDTAEKPQSTGNQTDTSQKQMTSTTTPEITVETLKALHQKGHEFFILDVRTDPEIAEARLSFLDGQISHDLLADNLDKLPKDRSAEIYIFCRSGNRSGMMTDYLRKIGYTNVSNVSGGIIAWREAGYEVISDD